MRVANRKKCPSGICKIEIDYYVCSGSFYVGSGNVALNKHNGNIYGGIGATQAGYDKLKGKLNLGGSCMAFTLGELDSKVKRGPLADAALNGNSFGIAYGGVFGFAVGADIPVSNGAAQVNSGVGLWTPGVTYFDFSHSKLIGNTKDTEPYAVGLMRSFGGI